MEDSYDFFIKFTDPISNGLFLGNITQIAISEESMEEAGLEWNSALTAAVTMATEEGVKKDSEEISGNFLWGSDILLFCDLITIMIMDTGSLLIIFASLSHAYYY